MAACECLTGLRPCLFQPCLQLSLKTGAALTTALLINPAYQTVWLLALHRAGALSPFLDPEQWSLAT